MLVDLFQTHNLEQFPHIYCIFKSNIFKQFVWPLKLSYTHMVKSIITLYHHSTLNYKTTV